MAYKDKEKQREYQRKWRKNKYWTDNEYRNRQRLLVTNKSKDYSIEAGKLVAEFRKNGCTRCSEKNYDCLCAHHKIPSNKEFSISVVSRGRHAPATLIKELKKCVCLCFNCHAKLHARQRRRKKKKELSNAKEL
jgi:hypothetical protein